MMRRDIDEALQGWPFEPESGEPAARQVKARDGRQVLQIRVELGLLQMEVEGRPDGGRPHGFPSYLEYLRNRAAAKSSSSGSKGRVWSMSKDHRAESDREFAQFSHRRVAWLALKKYDKALEDAEHSLALMDFILQHGADADYIASHERIRGLVLFHRTQAAAALALERFKYDEAIDAVREGMSRLVEHQRAWSVDNDADETPNESLIEQLRSLEDDIRKNFGVEKTLREQLDEAVADEDYERAARLRDQIKARS